MGCSIWKLPVAFALTFQLACGLETVELGPPVPHEEAEVTPGVESPQAEPEAAVPPPNTAVIGSELPSPLPEVPVSGLDGVGDFDIPPSSTAKGCQKVDFLFVIDNSPSMAFAQDNLKNSFPGFLRVLDAKVEVSDFQILVVDTDSSDGRREDDQAGAASLDRCNDTLGAGRRSNGDSQQACLVAGDQRFITLQQPELDATFSCMATVGTAGDADEQQVGALLQAVSTEENAAGGCNQGFLRSDALLVVTIITNTDDKDSIGEPDSWFSDLLKQRGGDEGSVVMLGFVPGDAFAPASSGFACNVLAAINRAPRLDDFINRFSHRSIASVCEGDYGPTFALAVDNIDLACAAFVPR
jgi:hypothetical protein